MTEIFGNYFVRLFLVCAFALICELCFMGDGSKGGVHTALRFVLSLTVCVTVFSFFNAEEADKVKNYLSAPLNINTEEGHDDILLYENIKTLTEKKISDNISTYFGINHTCVSIDFTVENQGELPELSIGQISVALPENTDTIKAIGIKTHLQGLFGESVPIYVN